MIDNEEVRAAIRDTIAKEILDKIDTSHRDAILQASIAKALKSYEFEKAIAGVVSAQAQKSAKALVSQDQWAERIEQAIADGFEDYLLQLRASVPKTLKRAFHGKKDSSYSSAFGYILDCWSPKDK